MYENEDIILGKLKSTETSLGEKAKQVDLTALQTSVNNIGNASPKGVYSTVPLLTAAKPTGDTGIYVVTGNVAEVASLAISAIPTVAGNVTVTLNGVAVNVAVDPATDTTTDLVATKIRNATYSGWTTGGTGSTITFTCNTTGAKTDSTYSVGSTGATGTMITTTQGVDADGKWYYWNSSAWTPGGTYQATALSDESVTDVKINGLFGENLLSYSNPETGGYYNTTTKLWVVDANMNVSNRIPVSYLDALKIEVIMSASIQYAMFDSSDNCIGGDTTFLSYSVGTKYLVVSNPNCAYIALQHNLNFNGLLVSSIKKHNMPNWLNYLTNKSNLNVISKIDYLKDYEFVLDWDSFEIAKVNSSFVKVVATTDLLKYYTVTPGDTIKIRIYNNIYLYNYVFFDASGNLISGYKPASGNVQLDFVETVPSNAVKIGVYAPITEIDATWISVFKVMNKSKWFGKKAVFFGTSIPAGYGSGITAINNPNSYPMLLGNILGMTMTNEAVGSSCVCARKTSLVNADTNPYGFTSNFEAVSRCLGNSIAEMQWVANWVDYRLNGGTYQNSGTYNANVFTSNIPTSWNSTNTDTIKSYSYENKLVARHLGDSNRKDIYFFEHGHNDSDTDNFTSDTTGANGMFSYSGAMNFLIGLILKDNPRAKIVIVSHYENQLTPSIVIAQKNVSDYWAIPFLALYDKLGWSQRTVITTGYWDSNSFWVNSGGTETTMTFRQIWIKDNLHPHTDKSGKADHFIAKQLSELVKAISPTYQP